MTVAPGKTQTVTLRTGKMPVKTWSPEEPNLYTLGVTLVRGGATIDRTETTIGFRTFETRDGAFYLNGRRYWLRGASHTPMGLAANDARLAEKFLKLMHDGNQMVTRDVCAPMSRTWFDAADRQGVGISHEGPWPWLMSGDVPSPELLEVWRDEQASLVLQNRNHPSLLMYTMNNEMFFTHDVGSPRRLEKWKELDKVIRLVRRLDPTRPISACSSYVRNREDWEKTLKPAGIDDGDVDDRHAYYGWYEDTHFKLFDGLWVRPGYGTTGINLDRPYISQECSTGYPNNDTGHPTRSYLFKHYTPQAFVGPWAYEDHDPAVFLRNRALVSKEVAEAIRRTCPEADGVLHFANICWFRNVYDADRIEPYPTYEAMKLALQPVLVSAELFGRQPLRRKRVHRPGVRRERCDGRRWLLPPTRASVGDSPRRDRARPGQSARAGGGARRPAVVRRDLRPAEDAAFAADELSARDVASAITARRSRRTSTTWCSPRGIGSRRVRRKRRSTFTPPTRRWASCWSSWA